MKRFSIILTLLLATTVLYAQDIVLPKPDITGGKPLMQALKARATNRLISDVPLSPNLLSNILWAANGVNRPDGKRTAPSASNCQEIEIYAFLPAGVYFYNPATHTLELKIEGDQRKEASTKASMSGVFLVYVANFDRMSRYSEDSKAFYSAADVGFVSQNVYLYCASEGLATVIMGQINKDVLATLLEIKNGKILLGQPVGYPQL